ncbi:hypothetical protein DFS34DRAFT_633576 [Phlyctochytrium arcticum]|nr:hypothetical protein DFS34DRAFT_633576 [Phlyctochytrium arcticum]
MAFNVFRLSMLAVLALCAYFGYQFTVGNSRSEVNEGRARRAAVARRDPPGVCTFQSGFLVSDVTIYERLAYDVSLTRNEAVEFCKNLQDGPFVLGQVQAASAVSSYGVEQINTYMRAICPAGAARVQDGKEVVWISSWNGDNYNNACIGMTIGANGKIAVTTRDCNEKHPVWCSKPDTHGQCSFCSPTPGIAQCHQTSSCTKYVDSGSNAYFCACRSGYKAAAGKPSWRLASTIQRAAGEDKNRVHVPPGVECNTLCENWALPNRCQEVANVCEGCFPGEASIDVMDGEGKVAKVPMRKAEPGMKFRVADADGNLGWSEVAFVVSLPGKVAYTTLEFYVPSRDNKESITLTATHLISVDYNNADQPILVQAGVLRAGQHIYHHEHGRVEIAAVLDTPLPDSAGAWTIIPSTPGALLVVDNVLVSPYATSPSLHARTDATFGALARFVYRALKVVGKEQWMASDKWTVATRMVQPWFVQFVGGMERIKSVDHRATAVAAAMLGVVAARKYIARA